MRRAAIPFVPAVTANGSAVAVVIADVGFVAPAVELMAVHFLPEIGGHTPVSERSAMQEAWAFGIYRTYDLPVAIQSGDCKAAGLGGQLGLHDAEEYQR